MRLHRRQVTGYCDADMFGTDLDPYLDQIAEQLADVLRAGRETAPELPLHVAGSDVSRPLCVAVSMSEIAVPTVVSTGQLRLRDDRSPDLCGDTSPDQGQLLPTGQPGPCPEDSCLGSASACQLPSAQSEKPKLPAHPVCFAPDACVTSGSLFFGLLSPGCPARVETLPEMPPANVTGREGVDISDEMIDRIIRFHHLKRRQSSPNYRLSAVLGIATALAATAGFVAVGAHVQRRESNIPETVQPVYTSRDSLALTSVTGIVEVKE